MVEIRIHKLSKHAKTPTKSYGSDAGWDLHVSAATLIPAGTNLDIPTDIEIDVPVGYFARITGRSSALNVRKLLVNEGIIDAGYHGHLHFNVMNIGKQDAWIMAGERVAQLLILPVLEVKWVRVDEMPTSERSRFGFGSSGF